MRAELRETLEATTRWDPDAAEREIFARWLASGVFHPEPAEPGYSIAIPPPNVTGALHMGHALNGSIQDALIRLHRMRGRPTRWILGTDHAGIGTQAVVEKELAAQGTSRQELGREEFVARVWEWRERYGSRIIEQFKRLGASADYEDERFTMDDAYARAVIRVFVELHRRGHIYRDNYMVNWDPGLGSAISDLEVEQRTLTDTLYSIAYPLADGGGSVTVATVRPETMLADTAVAVHPEDARYAELIGREVVLPLVGRRLPVIAEEHVDPEFGTGALKITPGHDPNDFEIGRRHGLPEISVIGEDGLMTAAAGEFAGLDVDDARAAVVAALRERGAVVAEEPYEHDVPHSHRSGRRIEPLISLQWFCDMTELAKPAISVVRDGRVRFHPERPWAKVYLDWLESIRPWCVSRQLWWGHRLPVYYCDACEETYVAEEPPPRCGACDGELRQDEDVLDTWFSSALWPFATLGWPESTPELAAWYPTDVLSTARDIIFLWVARMVMMGLEFTGEVPFHDVNIHSVIQAPDGRRMSKSLGTGIDPLDEIERHGADALRFGLLAMSSSQDVRYSDAKVQQGRDLANKVWNASRLVLLNAVEGVEPRPPAADAAVEDRWIASRLQRAVAAVTSHLDGYDFAHAAGELYRFFWSELCDWYLEIVKPRLYDGDEAASATLLWVLERTLALAHPVLPFVTEEVYSYLREAAGGERSELLAVHPFPAADEGLLDDGAEAELAAAIELTRALRRWRDLVGVPVAQVLAARVAGDPPHELVARLGRVSFDSAADGAEPLATIGPLEIVASEGLEPAHVRERVQARRTELSSEVARAEGKLSNEAFVARAPADVVAAEREKLAAYRAELAELDQ